MEYYFAPLEGITYYNFRAAHHDFFPGIDRYYTPFVVATYTRKMKSREKRDILPENNAGVPVVPQILTNDADEFLFCAKYMAEFGYKEVNLNAGCPVGTVTAKGKGSGLLRDPEKLDRLLDGIFEGLEKNTVRASGAEDSLHISVKTRLGWERPEEFERILGIYLRYPISMLIVHARTKKEMYGGEPEMEAFASAYETVKGAAGGTRICYNGNIRTPQDAEKMEARFPELDAIMIGRGLLEDPALVMKIRTGDVPNEMRRIREFHDELYRRYREQFRDERILVDHMKEIWGYLGKSVPGSEKGMKAIRKARTCAEYEAAVRMMWR